MAQTAELCNYCLSLIPPRQSSSNLTHYPTMGLLRQNSPHCPMCRLIQRESSLELIKIRFPDLSEVAYDLMLLEMKYTEVRTFASSLTWGLLTAIVRMPPLADSFEFKFFVTSCYSESSAALLPIWATRTTSTSDKISTLKAWLQDCELNHPNCKPKYDQIAERFIDVGSSDGRPVRLVKYTELDTPKQRYATLSYCWGDNKFCTTKGTAKAYGKEIPWESAPSTFRDAINIARALGIKYMWIDSLCIVQDDLIEWQREASKMADIYSGSLLTIAATDSADSSGGCFFEDDGDSVLDLEGNTDTIVGQENNAFLSIRKSEREPVMLVQIYTGDPRDSTKNAVLNSRGWVLQELVLSSRTVHCMRRGFYWHCKTAFKTEAGIEFDAMSLRKIPVPNHHHLPLALNEIWWRWVESYTKRLFTIPEDRLPAIAGLVRHYQAVTGDVPILGLWERSFPQDLLWVRLGDLEAQSGRSKIGYLPSIPSWSWLSCPTAVVFDFWKGSKMRMMRIMHRSVIMPP